MHQIRGRLLIENLTHHTKAAAVCGLTLLIFARMPAPILATPIPLSSSTAYTQTFDDIKPAKRAKLPADWRIDTQSAVRTVGSYAAAGAMTERLAGNRMPATAGNGPYNFGAGPGAAAKDRAVGFMSSGGGTQSGNLYVHFNNKTDEVMTGVMVSYDIEKYRNGSNPAGFSVQLYYSLDGNDWTSAGTDFLTDFPADEDTKGYAKAPGSTVVLDRRPLKVDIPSHRDFYLAWNYSVTSGKVTSRAQALAIDNVSVSGIADTSKDGG